MCGRGVGVGEPASSAANPSACFPAFSSPLRLYLPLFANERMFTSAHLLPSKPRKWGSPQPWAVLAGGGGGLRQVFVGGGPHTATTEFMTAARRGVW